MGVDNAVAGQNASMGAREASVIHSGLTNGYEDTLPGWWQEEEIDDGETKHLGAQSTTDGSSGGADAR
jgi:hypothetical protein